MKTKEEKAKEYSDNILLSDFFKVNHEKDFLAGYNQALQDYKAMEMLEMLIKAEKIFIDFTHGYELTKEIGKLIKEINHENI